MKIEWYSVLCAVAFIAAGCNESLQVDSPDGNIPPDSTFRNTDISLPNWTGPTTPLCLSALSISTITGPTRLLWTSDPQKKP